MSAYPPPTETLPIFNVNEFIGTTSTSQGGGGGGGTYVNYPNAQGVLNLVGFNSSGTASITNLVVNGTSDINNNINLSGDLVFDGINGSINFLDSTEQTSAYTGAGALSGAYTSANITLDTDGKITAISNGSGSLNPTFNSITIQDPVVATNTTTITQSGSDFTITNNETASVISLVADTTEVQDLNADSVVYSTDGTSQTSAFTGAGALTGSYTNTNMTIDANGKITALANGSAGTNLLPLNNTWTGTNNFTLTTTMTTATFSGDSTSQTSAYTGAGGLAGSYTSANLTVDANGKITALANGSGGGSYDDDLSIVYPLDLMTKQLAQVPTWNFTNTQAPVSFSSVRALAMSANGQYCLVSQNVVGGYVRRNSNYANPKNVDGTTSTWEIVSTLASSYIIGISPNGQYQFYSDGITMYVDDKFGQGGFSYSTALPSGQTCLSGYVRTSATGKYAWCYYQTGSAISIIYKSSNYGQTWTQVENSGAVQQYETYPQSQIAVSASGKYVSYQYSYGANDCRYKRSTNYGASFTTVASATLGFVMSGICMNMIGDILIAGGFNTNYPASNLAYFYISRDYGASWSSLPTIPSFNTDSVATIECCGMGQTIIVGNNTTTGAYVSYNYGQTWNALGTNKPYRNACLSANGGFCWGMNNASSPITMVIYNVPTYTPVVSVSTQVLASGNYTAPASQTIHLPFGLTRYATGATTVDSYFTCRISFTMMWKPNGGGSGREGFASYGGDIQFFPYRWNTGYGGTLTETAHCSQHLLLNSFATTANNNYSSAYGASTSNANMNLGRAFWLYNATSNGMGGDEMGLFCGVIGANDANGEPSLFFKCMTPYWLGGTPVGDLEINYSLDLINTGNMPTGGGAYIETFGMTNNWRLNY